LSGRLGSWRSTVGPEQESPDSRGTDPFFGDVAVVRVDDFLWWGDMETWWPRLRQEALEPLLTARPARFGVRDWKQDPLGRRLRDQAVIEPAETVLIEGVTSWRQDVADRVDLAFWVEASHETRLRRGLEVVVLAGR
jgi:hypothetical protein